MSIDSCNGSKSCNLAAHSKQELEACIKQIVCAKLQEILAKDMTDRYYQKDPSGVIGVDATQIKVKQEDRMDTGNPNDVVYTKDLFTLSESPRLGTGIMEMKKTTFDWLLKYDEVDYVIEGELKVIIDGRPVVARAGQVIYIPKNTKIQFSVPEFARFLYVTYPANWAEL